MRNKSRISVNLVILISILLLVNTISAGIYTEESDGTKTYISNGKFKEISEDGGMIMNSATGEFTYFSPDKMTYTQGKISEYCEAMSKIMNKMMQALPPEYKQMMGMNKKQKPPKIKIISEGDGGKIAGYKTTKYKVLADEILDEEIWLAEDASLIKEFASLVNMLSEFEKCNSKMEFGSQPVGFSPEYIALMQKGLTLKNKHYESDMVVNETKTVKIEIKDIRDKEFNVPAGYKKLPMIDFFGSQMEGME